MTLRTIYYNKPTQFSIHVEETVELHSDDHDRVLQLLEQLELQGVINSWGDEPALDTITAETLIANLEDMLDD